MRFDTWNERCLFMAGSLMTDEKRLSKLVGAEEVRWEDGGTEPAGECTFFYIKENENHKLGTSFLRIRESSTVKKSLVP
jgi:hypothetical protein